MKETGAFDLIGKDWGGHVKCSGTGSPQPHQNLLLLHFLLDFSKQRAKSQRKMPFGEADLSS